MADTKKPDKSVTEDAKKAAKTQVKKLSGDDIPDASADVDNNATSVGEGDYEMDATVPNVKAPVSTLHAVTKNTHNQEVHYLDASPQGAVSDDTIETAEVARLTGQAVGQRTRTSTARFTKEDLKELYPDAVAFGLHD